MSLEAGAPATPAQRRARLLERLVGVGAFLVPFGLVLMMIGPSPGWLDAPELTAAVASMGLSHPPGHPAYLLFARLFSLLPLGSLPFRMTLFSAMCFGLASWAAYRAALQLQALVLGERALSLTGRCLTCLAIWVGGCTYTASLQAVRPEVYTFHALLSLLMFERLLAAWRWGQLTETERESAWGLPTSDTKATLQGALLYGIGLANHHYLMLLTTPGILWFLWHRRRTLLPSLWSWGRIALIVCVGLSTYLYMPVRSAQRPAIHWGSAHTASGFTWQISAQAWQKSIKPSSRTQPMMQRGFLLLSLYLEQLGVWCLFVLVGLYVLIRMAPSPGVLVFLWGGGVLVGRLLMHVDRLDADLHGYLIVSMFLFAWMMAFLLVFAWTQLDELPVEKTSLRKAARGGVVLVALLPFSLMPYTALFPNEHPFSVAHSDRRGQLGPLLWSELMEDPLPYGTILVTSYYQNGFLRWYRGVIERQRPDLLLIQRNLLIHKPIAQLTGQRNPTLRHIVSRFRQDKKGFFTKLKALTKSRNVCFEYFQDLPDHVVQALTPTGMFFCWTPNKTATPKRTGRAEDDKATTEQQGHFWRVVYQTLSASLKRDKECRNILLWMHYQHALFYRETHRWQAGLTETRYALKLSPKSAEVKSLLLFFKKQLRGEVFPARITP